MRTYGTPEVPGRQHVPAPATGRGASASEKRRGLEHVGSTLTRVFTTIEAGTDSPSGRLVHPPLPAPPSTRHLHGGSTVAPAYDAGSRRHCDVIATSLRRIPTSFRRHSDATPRHAEGDPEPLPTTTTAPWMRSSVSVEGEVLAGAPRLLAEPTTRLESDSLSLAEYERLYAESCQKAAAPLRICEELGRKIGKLPSSVWWDVQRRELEVIGDRR